MDGHELPRSESVEQMARQVFTDLHQTIISHESGASAGNVESVHDMRVTVRRLRVALSNFAVCVPKEDRKRLRSKLENLADALGGVRDMDVMIAAMKLLAPSQEPGQDRTAISALISRLRARRRARLRSLTKYLDGAEYAGFKRESPSDWLKVNEPYSAYKTSSENSQAAPEEEHGQAA